MPVATEGVSGVPVHDRKQDAKRPKGLWMDGNADAVAKAKPVTNSSATRVLIVDDDPRVLRALAETIAGLGCHGTQAEDARDALFYFEKMPFDLVITDEAMPGINGFQLARQIKRKRPGTKVIVMTSAGDRAISERVGGDAMIDGLLIKPFDAGTLRRAIEAVGAGRIHYK